MCTHDDNCDITSTSLLPIENNEWNESTWLYPAHRNVATPLTNTKVYLTTNTVVGQLRPWKWHYCAVSVKSVRFGRECKQSKSNIFLICHILWHFQDGRHWPWEFHMGQKLKHAPISLIIVSNWLSCHKDSENV